MNKYQMNKPNGWCEQCGAPLNEHCVGGYKLNDGYNTEAVSAFVNMTAEQCKFYRDLINKRLKKLRRNK